MTANAQTGYFKPLSFGLGYGVTLAQAGEQTLTSSNAADFNFNYHFTPFTSVSIETQIGTLTSGDKLHDTFAKQFTNNYISVLTHADIQLGEFIDYSHSPFLNGIKNFYAGIGVGVLLNNITDIQTVNRDTTETAPLTYTPTSVNLLIPIRLGYEFKIFNRYDEPAIRFDINYSFNTAFGSGLDGYTSIYSHPFVKFYNYVSVGLKYCFGPTRSYHKQIYYNEF